MSRYSPNLVNPGAISRCLSSDTSPSSRIMPFISTNTASPPGCRTRTISSMSPRQWRICSQLHHIVGALSDAHADSQEARMDNVECPVRKRQSSGSVVDFEPAIFRHVFFLYRRKV